MKSLREIFNVKIKYKTKSEHSCKCESTCSKNWFSKYVLKQLLGTVKKKRGVSVLGQNSPPPNYFDEEIIKHFKSKQNYMFVLNADPYIYHGYQNENTKRKYQHYLWVIKKALRGKPYKNASYHVYPEYGSKNAKFHVNLVINLEYYPYVKSLCHDLRKLLTTSKTRYPSYSCTLPRTYGRKPNTYACKDAYYMYKLGIVPFIKEKK